ncbi:MAG: hypothetical protein H6Q53_1238 [Deltaproteobacteria bacterium]|jgi:hypothetical protein|nr:hypothetical protein [Deltaproteobacteria bacterium]
MAGERNANEEGQVSFQYVALSQIRLRVLPTVLILLYISIHPTLKRVNVESFEKTGYLVYIFSNNNERDRNKIPKRSELWITAILKVSWALKCTPICSQRAKSSVDVQQNSAQNRTATPALRAWGYPVRCRSLTGKLLILQ